MALKITVRNKQSLLDIALQETGALEAVAQLMVQNDLSITDALAAGMIIGLEPVVENADIKDYYKRKNLHPATGFQPGQVQGLEGIGEWRIIEDFIISGS